MRPTEFDVNDLHFIPFIRSFKYLGSIINDELDDIQDIRTRGTQAFVGFNKLKPILCNRKINRKSKRELYLTLIVNILLWGCESWAIDGNGFAELQKWHHFFVKKMCHVHPLMFRDIPGLSMKKLLTDMDLPEIDKMVEIRRVRFLRKLALNPLSLPARCLGSQGLAPPGLSLPSGSHKTTTLCSLKKTLKKAGVICELGDDFAHWVPTLRLPIGKLGKIVDNRLGLEEGSFAKRKKKKKKIS